MTKDKINKLLIFFIVFFTIISFATFAFAYDYNWNGNNVFIPDSNINNDKVCVFYYYSSSSDKYYFLQVWGSPAPAKYTSYLNSNDGTNITVKTSTSLYAIYNYDHLTGNLGSLVETGNNSVFPFNKSTRQLVFSSIPVYTDSSLTDIFFFKTKPLYPTLTIQEVTQIPFQMTQVLQKIIPIGLLVLSMVLLVFLIRWVILRII